MQTLSSLDNTEVAVLKDPIAAVLFLHLSTICLVQVLKIIHFWVFGFFSNYPAYILSYVSNI